MANQLTVQEQETIRSLARQGWKIRRIAQELGISRNTVRQYVRQMNAAASAGAAASESGSPVQIDPLSTSGPIQTDPLSTAGKTGRRSLCEAHQAFIGEGVAQGVSAQRIFQDLQTQKGFAGSYQSVKRYVARLRACLPEPVCRVEVQPGEEVQVDFGAGPLLVDESGKRFRTWIFRMVLSFSRKGYTEAVRRQDTESFVRCLENAFRHFGGVALTLNLDNLKAGILKYDWADPELNPKLRDFAQHYGITILPCRPRTPEHKGKVENSIAYVRGNALAGRSFTSVPGLNQVLFSWEAGVADQRIHGTTKRQVAQLFAVEKPALLPLPAMLFPCFQEGQRTVHRDGHVEVARAYYHVPPEYLRHTVWVRYDSREVRIFVQLKDSSLKLIQTHRRLDPGQFTQTRGLGGGYGPVQVQVGYWLKRAECMGHGCAAWARGLVAQRGIDGLRALMGLVHLSDTQALGALNRACAKASAKGAWRLRDVRSLLENTTTQTQFQFEENHPLIRDLSEYGIFVRSQTSSITP